MNHTKLALATFLAIAFLSSCKQHKSEKAAEKMQTFITDIASYARGFDPDFIVIPQNGPELAYEEGNPDNPLKTDFLATIDGFGIEELFYNEGAETDHYRLDMLREIGESETIMVSDVLGASSQWDNCVNTNNDEGFIPFPRLPGNYDYLSIPSTVYNENDLNITSLSDIQNYLYLIGNEGFDDAEAMIQAIESTNYDLVLVDLFFGDEPLTSSQVNRLKTKANGASRLAIAYMSIGSAENYRYYWKKSWFLHCPNWLKRRYDGYPDEFWVKFWNKTWQEIIFGNDDSYTHKIIDAGFDGVYLDNVEAYYFLYYRD